MENPFLLNFDDKNWIYDSSTFLRPTAPIWDIKYLDTRNRVSYCAFTVQAQRKSDEESTSQTAEEKRPISSKYKCFLCNIQVPTIFRNEHENSPKHKLNAKIAQCALSRVKKIIFPFNDTTNVKSKKTYYCEPCADEIKIKDRKKHKISKEHYKSILHDRFLNDLLMLYEDKDYLDKADFGYLTSNKIYNDEINSIISSEDISDVDASDESYDDDDIDVDDNDDDDEADLESEHNEEVKENCDEDNDEFLNTEMSVLENLNEADMNVFIQRVIKQDLMHRIALRGKKIVIRVAAERVFEVAFDNFNGVHTREGHTQCRVCRVMVDESMLFNHVMTVGHVTKMRIPINVMHCFREIDATYKHCIVCNEIFIVSDSHVIAKKHEAKLRQAKLVFTPEIDKCFHPIESFIPHNPVPILDAPGQHFMNQFYPPFHNFPPFPNYPCPPQPNPNSPPAHHFNSFQNFPSGPNFRPSQNALIPTPNFFPAQNPQMNPGQNALLPTPNFFPGQNPQMNPGQNPFPTQRFNPSQNALQPSNFNPTPNLNLTPPPGFDDVPNHALVPWTPYSPLDCTGQSQINFPPRPNMPSPPIPAEVKGQPNPGQQISLEQKTYCRHCNLFINALYYSSHVLSHVYVNNFMSNSVIGPRKLSCNICQQLVSFADLQTHFDTHTITEDITVDNTFCAACKIVLDCNKLKEHFKSDLHQHNVDKAVKKIKETDFVREMAAEIKTSAATQMRNKKFSAAQKALTERETTVAETVQNFNQKNSVEQTMVKKLDLSEKNNNGTGKNNKSSTTTKSSTAALKISNQKIQVLMVPGIIRKTPIAYSEHDSAQNWSSTVKEDSSTKNKRSSAEIVYNLTQKQCSSNKEESLIETVTRLQSSASTERNSVSIKCVMSKDDQECNSIKKEISSIKTQLNNAKTELSTVPIENVMRKDDQECNSTKKEGSSTESKSFVTKNERSSIPVKYIIKNDEHSSIETICSVAKVEPSLGKPCIKRAILKTSSIKEPFSTKTEPCSSKIIPFSLKSEISAKTEKLSSKTGLSPSKVEPGSAKIRSKFQAGMDAGCSPVAKRNTALMIAKSAQRERSFQTEFMAITKSSSKCTDQQQLNINKGNQCTSEEKCDKLNKQCDTIKGCKTPEKVISEIQIKPASTQVESNTSQTDCNTGLVTCDPTQGCDSAQIGCNVDDIESNPNQTIHNTDASNEPNCNVVNKHKESETDGLVLSASASATNTVAEAAKKPKRIRVRTRKLKTIPKITESDQPKPIPAKADAKKQTYINYQVKYSPETGIVCRVCNLRIPNDLPTIYRHIMKDSHIRFYNELLYTNNIKQIDLANYHNPVTANFLYCERCELRLEVGDELDHIDAHHFPTVMKESKCSTYYCEKCEIHIADTADERKNHENSFTHTETHPIDNATEALKNKGIAHYFDITRSYAFLLCKVCDINVPAINAKKHTLTVDHIWKQKSIFDDNQIVKVFNDNYYCNFCKIHIKDKNEFNHINNGYHMISKLEASGFLDDRFSPLYFCSVCETNVPNNIFNIKEHDATNAHKNKADLMVYNEAKVVMGKTNNPSQLVCQLCRMIVPVMAVYEHILGAWHQSSKG